MNNSTAKYKQNPIDIIFLIVDGIILIFCGFVLPPSLYFLATININIGIVTNLFAVDWTIFGVFVAISGVLIALMKGTKNDGKLPFSLLSQIITVVVDSVFCSIMLLVTATSIFFENEKLFTVLVLSALYFLSLTLINYVVVYIIALTRNYFRNHKAKDEN